MELAKGAPLASALDTDSVLLERAGVAPYRIARSLFLNGAASMPRTRQLGTSVTALANWFTDEINGAPVATAATTLVDVVTFDISALSPKTMVVRFFIRVKDAGSELGIAEYVAYIQNGSLSGFTLVVGNISVGTPSADVNANIVRLRITPADSVAYTWLGRIETKRAA